MKAAASPIERQEKEENPQLGQRMPNGTVYFGLDRWGNTLLTTPELDPAVYTHENVSLAAEVLRQNKAYGHSNWNAMGKEELDLYCKNIDRLGITFNGKAMKSDGSAPTVWSQTMDQYMDGWSQKPGAAPEITESNWSNRLPVPCMYRVLRKP